MMKKVRLIGICSLAVLIHSLNDVSAQESQSRCSQIGYKVPELSKHKHRLHGIEGQTVYASASQKWELGSGNGVCVIIFQNKTRQRVASVRTDEKGQFVFTNIPPGEYTLVASAGDLQIISISVQIIPNKRNYQSQRLLLHLREKDDRRKSYVTQVTNPALRKELLGMAENDQNIRNEMIKGGSDSPSKEVSARMDVIDRQNTLRIKSIIKEYGWPGPGLVGWDGSAAAFLIVQHADHMTQKVLLPLIQRAFKTGNLSGPNYALFIDRVLVEDGKPQIYGSRARPFNEWKAGEPMLYPIEDEANVDKRRAKVGLSTLAEYRVTLKQMYYPR